MNRKEAISKILSNREKRTDLILRLSARKWPAVRCPELEAKIHKVITENVKLKAKFKITDKEIREADKPIEVTKTREGKKLL